MEIPTKKSGVIITPEDEALKKVDLGMGDSSKTALISSQLSEE
jgi:hypothetical protein